MMQARVRMPAILLGLVLTTVLCALTPYNNIRIQNSPLAGSHFPLASFGCFFLLILVVNPVLGRIRRPWRLHRDEIFLIWSMVTVATGIAYTGLLRTFLVNLTTPAWLGAGAAPAAKVLTPLLPPGLFPLDPEAVRALYSGLDGGWDLGWWQVFARIPWHAWLLPMLFWGAFIGLVYVTIFGLVGLFSHQWIENEKMNFPLLRVLEVLGGEADRERLGAYLGHKYFLIGLGLPVALHLLNGLATYFPQVPSVPTLVLMQPFMPKEGLLSGFYKLKIYFYPAFIGFAYLTSKQVSFSLWFFFLLGGLLPGLLQLFGWRLPAAALGTTFGPVLARVEEMQMVGAFGVFFLFILYLARSHLHMVAAGLLRSGRSGAEPEYGLLGSRASCRLFIVGFLGCAAWLRAFGMDLGAALLLLLVCFMLQLVSARLICQGGLPYFTLTAAPSDGFLAFLDSRLLAPLTLYLGAVVQKITFLDLREALMPSLMHASKLGEESRPRRRFLWALAGAVLIGITVSFAAMLALCYKYGINTLPDDWAIETSRRVHENVAQLIQYPETGKGWSTLFALVGGAVMLLLVLGYHQFIWWPLHPIGYLTTYSSAMRILWFSFFLGWAVNTLVLRYGGVNQFKEVRRLFIGLIAGDMLMALVWLLVGLYAPHSYHVLPL